MGVILLVGERPENASGLRALLRKDGHDVTWIRRSEAWQATEHEVQPDLVVAAVEEPAALLSTRADDVRGFPPPLLFVEHDNELLQDTLLEERLVDRMASPFAPQEFLARVDALVRVRKVIRQGRTAEAPQQSPRGIRGRLSALLARRLPREPRPAGPYLEVAARLSDWADRRDMFEPGHAGRVASFCAMMADALSVVDDELEILLRAAMLHDIGKITLPVEILRHRGPLDENKMRLVRTHAERGAALLRALDPVDEAARVILYHHERPDGTGYYRKTAEAVPRAARILAVAEAYDAMTSSRCLEPVKSKAAISWLGDRRGVQFDADAVDALVDSMKPHGRGVPLSV